jgi:5,10-methylenetetrahydrofolate reductase
MTTASLDIEKENLQVIAAFHANFPQHRVETMGTVIKQGGNPFGQEAYNPVEPQQLERWLDALANHPVFKKRRLIISMRRLVNFDSFDGPVSMIDLPDKPVTLVGIESNWVRYIESSGKSFEQIIQTRIELVTDDSPWVYFDEEYQPLHKSLANDLSREFFWRRLDVWIKGTGQTHEAGHNEDLPKTNRWFIQRCVREFVEHLESIGPLPEKINLMEQGAARAELIRNFLLELEENYPSVFAKVHKVYIAEFSKDILDHGSIASHLRTRYKDLIELVYYHPDEFPRRFYDIYDGVIDLRGQIHFLTHNNVFDQLASRLIHKIDGQCYEELVKLYIDTSNPDIIEMLVENDWTPEEMVECIHKAVVKGIENLVGPNSDNDGEAYPYFKRWQAILSSSGGKRALQFYRKLVPIDDPKVYFAQDDRDLNLSLSVAMQEVLDARNYCRMLINMEALSYYARSFELLAEGGQTQMTNLFCQVDNQNQVHVRDVLRMDGSLITSLNADLFQSVSNRIRRGSITRYSRVGDFVAEEGGSIRGVGLGILRTRLSVSLAAAQKLQMLKQKTDFIVGLEWPNIHDSHSQSLEDRADYFETLEFDAVSVVDVPPEVDGEPKFERLHHSSNAVIHVAGHLRTEDEIIQRLKHSIREGAKGFLIMSGGGPMRMMLLNYWMKLIFKLPPPLTRITLSTIESLSKIFSRLMEFYWPGTSRLPDWFEQAYTFNKKGIKPELDSIRVLQIVRDLQQNGSLSTRLSAWLVASSYRDNKKVMKEKFAAGPDALICQPPLYWSSFKKWLDKLQDLPESKPILVGVPVIASPRNLRFWYALIGDYFWFLPWKPGFWMWLRFVKANQKGKDKFDEYSQAWSLELIRKLKKEKGVAGIHLMPMGKWRSLDELVREARSR